VRAKALRNLEAAARFEFENTAPRGAAFGSIAKRLFLRVMGVTRYKSVGEDGTVVIKDMPAPKAETMTELLASQWAADVVGRHRAALAQGGGRVVQAAEGNTYAEAQTWLNGGDAHDDGDGWRAVRYLSFLLAERVEWINTRLGGQDAEQLAAEGAARDRDDDAGNRGPNDINDEIEDEHELDEGALAADDADDDEGGDADEDGAAGADAAKAAAARVSIADWYTRRCFPRLFAYFPMPHHFSRNIQISNTGCINIYGHGLDAIFVRPAPPFGMVLGDSIMTNGETLSVLYEYPKGTRKAARAARTTTFVARRDDIAAAYAAAPVDLTDVAALGAFADRVGLRFAGLDPGKIATTAREPLPNGTVRKWDLSFATWENQTCAPQRRAHAAHWMADVDKNPLVVAARALTYKTTSAAGILAWAAADARASPVVLAEKLKPRWANESFRSWQLRTGVLARYAGRFGAGVLEDGRAGVRPLLAFGDAKLNASSRGRKAGPTSAIFKAFVDVLGADCVVSTPECGSTLAHHTCTATLQDVYRDGPSARERARAEAKAEYWATSGRGDGRAPHAAPHWHDSMSVRRCANFDGVDGGAPCVNAGKLVSRDGNAALQMVRRTVGDVCGLPVPTDLRPSQVGRRVKPPPLRLARTVR
jgi:hypothetical protein